MPIPILPLLSLAGWLRVADPTYWATLLLAVALAASPLGVFLFHRAALLLDRIAQDQARSLIAVGLISLAICITTSLALDIPAPRLHDEFSQLLAADTYAHGRLANPVHPMATHFETIHVLQQHSYASKFPPGQGLVLAFGMVTVGLPIAGAWLAVAAACASLCWMLYAYVPARWALVGGLVAACQPQILTWGQCYLGGGLPLAAGAIVLGSARRLVDGPRLSHAFLFGLGLAILANSRPYEGALFSLPIAIGLVIGIIRADRPTRRAACVRLLLPCLVMLAIVLLAMGYYNRRVTGSALLSPYVLHESLYNRTPHFVFQSLRLPIVYQQKERAELHGRWEPSHWLRQRSFMGFASAASERLGVLLATWLDPPLLGALLVALPAVLRRSRPSRHVALVLLVLAAGLIPLTWPLKGHYLAPSGAAAFVLLVACMHHLHTVPSRRLWLRKALVRSVLAATVVAAYHQATVLYANEINGWQTFRVKIVRMLTKEPGQHLVIVRYLPGHDVHQEWVYNAADIDRSRIVWARRTDPAQDGELLDYYRGRLAWLLEVGQTIRLTAYPGR